MVLVLCIPVPSLRLLLEEIRPQLCQRFLARCPIIHELGGQRRRAGRLGNRRAGRAELPGAGGSRTRETRLLALFCATVNDSPEIMESTYHRSSQGALQSVAGSGISSGLIGPTRENARGDS